jgi:hypothetical protein
VIPGKTWDGATGVTAVSATDQHDRRPDNITFIVDGEPVSTEERVLTPVQIMELAHVDPVTNYLVRVEGRHQISYKDKPNEKIEVHEDETFVTVSTGPTPVS